MVAHLLLITGIVCAALYWSDAMAAQERAFKAVNEHCLQLDVQMLDYYVALNRLKLKRDDHGRLRVWRSFQFEFSATGAERYNGCIIMRGRRIESIVMEPYRIN